MSPLEIKMLAMRSALLTDMRSVTVDMPEEELFRIIGSWKRLRKTVTEAATQPGEARAYIEALWTTPEWKTFDRVRSITRKRKARREAGRKYKAAEALRKRMAYYKVDDPSKLPPKSPRGRKTTLKAA